MDEEYQRMAANSIAHEAFCAGQAWQQAAAAQERPCVLWKPSLFRDGNQWCALLGENIQEGVVGFGDSPDAAMWAFDEAWREKLPPAPGAQPAPKAVAYLDLGVGGYMDIGTDLTDEQLASLPKGRHMLGIVGTYGVDGYVSAQPGAQSKLDEIKIALHRALELGKRETWTGAKKYRSREGQREEQQCWDKVWNLLGAKGE